MEQKSKRRTQSLRRVRCSALVSPLKTEHEAMEYLRKNHPEFFENQSSRELAAVIILEMGDELAKHSPVERSGMIAGIMALMYQMGTAALKTIRDEKKRNMARILVDDYRANDPSSATRPTGRHDCNHDAMAGFAAAHG